MAQRHPKLSDPAEPHLITAPRRQHLVLDASADLRRTAAEAAEPRGNRFQAAGSN
jgi:hypothetical protein